MTCRVIWTNKKVGRRLEAKMRSFRTVGSEVGASSKGMVRVWGETTGVLKTVDGKAEVTKVLINPQVRKEKI